MEYIIYGDYIVTPIKNAFNNKITYWISKHGYTVAYYMFTEINKKDTEKQLENIKQYIKMFEARILD